VNDGTPQSPWTGVPPQPLISLESPYQETRDVDIASITGVGSSALGSAALAWDISVIGGLGGVGHLEIGDRVFFLELEPPSDHDPKKAEGVLRDLSSGFWPILYFIQDDVERHRLGRHSGRLIVQMRNTITPDNALPANRINHRMDPIRRFGEVRKGRSC
jgi:hypothetical protein